MAAADQRAVCYQLPAGVRRLRAPVCNERSHYEATGTAMIESNARFTPRLGRGLAALLLAAMSAVACAEPNVVDQIAARCGSHSRTYDNVLAALKQLDASNRVSVVSIGKSSRGRAIPLAAVYHPQTVYGQTARVFIIARQHGGEASGTDAMVALIDHLAQTNRSTELALLQRLTFAIVPIANPDGAVANQRRNAAGVDLNRDWVNISQPETKAIEWAFRAWRPHAFIDLHELPAQSSKASFQENFVETIAEDPHFDANMTQMCSYLTDQVRRYEIAYGHSLNLYYDDRNTNRTLAHRHFGMDYGVPSFLFEVKTGPGRPLQRCVKFHIVGTLVIANLLAQRVTPPPTATPVQPPRTVPIQPTPIPLPRVPATPPVKRPSLPAETVVKFVSPGSEGEAFSGRIPLRVDVERSAAFAYLSLHVDGIMRALTDATPYEHDLSVESYENGPHSLVLRAHDGSGRVIAEAKRQVVVQNAVAGR